MLKKYSLQCNAMVLDENDEGKIQVYTSPDANEKQEILTTANLDIHSLSSALDPDEISRVEFQPNHTFIIWKRPGNYHFEEYVRFYISSIGMMLSSDRFVMILSEEYTLIDEKHPYKMNNNTDILLTLLSQSTRHFLEHLKIIKQISREIQEKINTALENEYLIQMFTLGESLTYYLNAITSNSMVLTKIRNNTEKLGLSTQQVEFLDDIIIENNQCSKQAEIYSNILSGLMDARGSLVNNNMNVHLRKLTIINTVLLPLNLIASVFGMSEFTMMTRSHDWRIAYPMFFLGMIIVGVITTIFINKFNWWQKKQSRVKFPKLTIRKK